MSQPHLVTPASAGVVTFNTDMRVPLKELKVNIEPVQDLHGYANPWPAGGGTNLFNINASGEWSCPSGAEEISIVDDVAYIKILSSGQTAAYGPQQFEGNKSVYISLSGSAVGVRAYVRLRKTDDSGWITSDDFTMSGWTYVAFYNGWVSSSDSSTLSKAVDIPNCLYWNFGIGFTTGDLEVGTTQSINEIIVANGSTAVSYSPYSNICPIAGQDDVNVTRTGKNLLDVSQANEVRKNGGTLFTLDYLGDNSVRMNTSTVGALYVIWEVLKVTRSLVGQYLTVSYDGDGFLLIYKTASKDGLWQALPISFTSNIKTVQITEDDIGRAFGIGFYNSSGSIKTLSNVCVEFGSTATTYEPYTGTTIPVTFPGLGKNLFNINNTTLHPSATLTDGEIYITSPAQQSIWITSRLIPFSGALGTQYTLSAKIKSASANNVGIAIHYTDETIGYGNRSDSAGEYFTSTVVSDSTKVIDGFGLSYRGTAIETWIKDIQIELSSTATDYEPYTNTAYGGYVDLVNGQLVVDRASVDLGTLTWTLSTYGNGNHVFVSNLIATKSNTGIGNIPNIKCECYKIVSAKSATSWSTATEDMRVTLGYDTSRVWIRDTRYSDSTAFATAINGTQLVYELATPITYTLTASEIRTLLGTNNVWSDAGNVELSYWTHTH